MAWAIACGQTKQTKRKQASNHANQHKLMDFTCRNRPAPHISKSLPPGFRKWLLGLADLSEVGPMQWLEPLRVVKRNNPKDNKQAITRTNTKSWMLHVETGPLHIFPKATPGLAEVVAWLGRPQRGGYTLSFSPRKGWVIADFLIDDLCSISFDTSVGWDGVGYCYIYRIYRSNLDTSALVVETVWVIVTYIEVTLTPMPLWSRRCGLHKYQPS